MAQIIALGQSGQYAAGCPLRLPNFGAYWVVQPKFGSGGTVWPRPGNDLVQLKLFRDYATNAPLYPRLHDYIRASGFSLLAAWGRCDEIFARLARRRSPTTYPGRRSTCWTAGISYWNRHWAKSPN